LILGNIFLFILLFIQGKIYQQHLKKLPQRKEH